MTAGASQLDIAIRAYKLSGFAPEFKTSIAELAFDSAFKMAMKRTVNMETTLEMREDMSRELAAISVSKLVRAVEENKTIEEGFPYLKGIVRNEVATLVRKENAHKKKLANFEEQQARLADQRREAAERAQDPESRHVQEEVRRLIASADPIMRQALEHLLEERKPRELGEEIYNERLRQNLIDVSTPEAREKAIIDARDTGYQRLKRAKKWFKDTALQEGLWFS